MLKSTSIKYRLYKRYIMKKFFLLTIVMVSLGVFSVANAQSKAKPNPEGIENLKPYPAKLDSLERHVIFLQKMDNESDFEVELYVGKTLLVDCNRHGLMGDFSEETVQGWGYTYQVFNTEGHIFSTMMACPGEKEEKFVKSPSQMVRYNSRLPIVIYVPEGYEVRYRIWTAGEEAKVEKQ